MNKLMEQMKHNVINRETLIPAGIAVAIIVFLVSTAVYGAVKITTIQNEVSNNADDIQRLSDRQIPRSEVQLRLEGIRTEVGNVNDKVDKLLKRFSIE